MFWKKILHIGRTKQQIIIPIIILGLFFLLQIPFLESDPDIHISFSRGANTDEGLHSCQVRNYINTGDLTMDKSDNLVKTPLFGFLIFLVISSFGSDLVVGRIAVLLLSLFICFFSLKKGKNTLKYSLLLIPIVFLQYHVFHFFHFCLAEILCTILILSSIFYTIDKTNGFDLRKNIMSSILVSIAYFIKIQFFYIIALLPIYHFILLLIDPKKKRENLKNLISSCLFLGIGIIIYLLIWYLPNKELFHYVMLDQTDGRFATTNKLWDNIKWIHDYFFMGFGLKYFTILFYIAFPLGLFLFFKTRSTFYKHLFIGLTFWLFLESHKLGMTYLPTRYFISFIFPMGGITALVLFESWNLLKGKKSVFFAIPLIVVIIISSINLSHYINAYSRRTFAIKELNEYFSNYDLKGKKIIGPWAPSLSWKTNAVSYPVWNGYFNSESVFTEQNPNIIISEKMRKILIMLILPKA